MGAKRWLLGAVLLLVLIGDAAAAKTARRRHRRGRQVAAARHARTLLQADSAAAGSASAPAGPPLPTPANALTVCSKDALRKATKCKDRKHVFVEEHGEEADEECCKRMSEYYSNASKMATRNCWCDADVWARNAELETYISFAGFFDACAAENYTVGNEAINYYQGGAGPCAGMAPAAVVEEVMPAMEKPPARSFGKWVREGLPDNPWLLFSFIMAIPSVIGFSIMMWPFVFHAVLTVVEFPQKRAAKKGL